MGEGEGGGGGGRKDVGDENYPGGARGAIRPI